MAGTIFAKSVSKKINKIRWKSASKENVVEKLTVFATGSWDDQENELCLWTLPDALDDDKQHQDPEKLCSTPHYGDVTDLLFYQPEIIISSSSTGTVSVFKHHVNSQTISEVHSWSRLHRYSVGGATEECPCTAIASRDDHMLATVGQDGRLCILDLNEPAPLSVVEKADSCSLNAVTFLKQTEVAAVNSVGQFKVWDTRQDPNESVKNFAITGERFPLYCMDRHPTQSHIVVTGGQNGALYVWDMRQERYPITIHDGHTVDMLEVHFHPTHPDNLFTCSNDGSAWRWDSASSGGQGASSISLLKSGRGGTGTPRLNATVDLSTTSAWLSGSKRSLEIFDLIPSNIMAVNSIDVASNVLLCGTDAEQIFIIDGIPIS